MCILRISYCVVLVLIVCNRENESSDIICKSLLALYCIPLHIVAYVQTCMVYFRWNTYFPAVTGDHGHPLLDTY